MAEKIRFNLQISAELNRTLDEIAESGGATKSDVVRQALALMKVAHEAKLKGRHVGIVSDPSKLDAEFVGLI